MASTINRREFLKRGSAAAGLTLASSGLAAALYTPTRATFPEQVEQMTTRDLRVGTADTLAVIHGTDPARMVRAAVAELGGMGAFVKKGDRVLVKPNIGWDRLPEQAANTNPDLVRAVIAMCFEAGAASVLVTDMPCNDARRTYARSGIEDAAREAGATVERPDPNRFRDVNMGGKLLGTRKLYSAYLEVDKVINLPIAKHHSLSGATLALKNLYGIIGGARHTLHQDIHRGIAELGSFLRATLTIIDAYRVLRRNGPQGGNLDDVEQLGLCIASADPIAADAYAGETIFQLGPDALRHVIIGTELGLGQKDYRQLRLVESTVQ